MIKKIKKHQRRFLIILIIVCMGIILTGGIRYVRTLRNNLQNNAFKNVMSVTIQ